MNSPTTCRGDSAVAPAKAPPIQSALQAALIIVTEAHKAGIPIPRRAGQMEVGADEEAQLVLYMDSLDDLAHWSVWLEQSINTSSYLMPSGHVHSSIDARLYDHNVRVTCLYNPGEVQS